MRAAWLWPIFVILPSLKYFYHSLFLFICISFMLALFYSIVFACFTIFFIVLLMFILLILVLLLLQLNLPSPIHYLQFLLIATYFTQPTCFDLHFFFFSPSSIFMQHIFFAFADNFSLYFQIILITDFLLALLLVSAFVSIQIMYRPLTPIKFWDQNSFICYFHLDIFSHFFNFLIGYNFFFSLNFFCYTYLYNYPQNCPSFFGFFLIFSFLESLYFLGTVPLEITNHFNIMQYFTLFILYTLLDFGFGYCQPSFFSISFYLLFVFIIFLFEPISNLFSVGEAQIFILVSFTLIFKLHIIFHSHFHHLFFLFIYKTQRFFKQLIFKFVFFLYWHNKILIFSQFLDVIQHLFYQMKIQQLAEGHQNQESQEIGYLDHFYLTIN